jgi:hypothetical protein
MPVMMIDDSDAAALIVLGPARSAARWCEPC